MSAPRQGESRPPVWTPTPEGILVRVRVQPRSSRPGVAGRHGESLRVRVSAPPVEGAANDELVELVAKWLAVPKGTVTIVRGRGGRDKVLEVTTPSPAALGARLDRLLGEFVDKAGAGG